MSPDSGSVPEVEHVVGFYHPWAGLIGEHVYLILIRPVRFLAVSALSPCGGSNAVLAGAGRSQLFANQHI